MKKLLKWSAIIIGSLLGLLIIAAVALPFFLPLEKIKTLATEKISETINREVKIEKVAFNIFEGIKLEGLTISNRQGYAKKPFVSADAIVLRYAFWPIFKRQVLVKEISLVKPEILIEKSASGTFNFSDMSKKNTRTSENLPAGRQGQNVKIRESEDQKDKKQAFSMIVDSFSIKKGRITYSDYSTGLTNEIKDFKLSISGITLSMLKPINFKTSATATYKGKDISISLAGKAELNLQEEKVKIPNLALNLAGEKAHISAYVTKWKTGPYVDFSISSKKLTVDPLLAIFASEKPKKKAERGKLTKTVNKATKSIKSNYHIKANIDIENLKLLDFKVDQIKLNTVLKSKRLALTIDKIKLYDGEISGKANVNLATSGLSYNISKLKINGFNSTPFINDAVEAFLTNLDDYKDLKDKVYGKLDAELTLTGQGVETQDIMANAVGSGSFKLVNGEIKKSKLLSSLGKAIKSNTLQDNIKFSDLSAKFTFKKRVVTVKDLKLSSGDLKVKFNGGADLAKLVWVSGNRLNLKASPKVTQGLSKEFNIFRDKTGWVELDFELTGSLKKPIPVPILNKPIEKAIEKVKLKIEAKKIEIQKQAEDKIQEEAKKAEEQAKKQLEEEAKKQLKNLINF